MNDIKKITPKDTKHVKPRDNVQNNESNDMNGNKSSKAKSKNKKTRKNIETPLLGIGTEDHMDNYDANN